MLCLPTSTIAFRPSFLLRPALSVRSLSLSASKTGPIFPATSPTAPSLTLYTKAGCSLCDQVVASLQAIRDGDSCDFDLAAVDITDAGNADFDDRYKFDIPVVHKDGVYFFKHRMPFEGDAEMMREAILENGGPVGQEPDARKMRMK